ncbi:hypothetical protein V8G54_029664, partial [Vigna mungo]
MHSRVPFGLNLVNKISNGRIIFLRMRCCLMLRMSTTRLRNGPNRTDWQTKKPGVTLKDKETTEYTCNKEKGKKMILLKKEKEGTYMLLSLSDKHKDSIELTRTQ